MRLLFFIAGLISATFCYAQEDVYSVRGKIGKVKENTKVFLYYRKGGESQLDSTYVRNNQFEFKGNVSEPFSALAFITCLDISAHFLISSFNGELEMTAFLIESALFNRISPFST